MGIKWDMQSRENRFGLDPCNRHVLFCGCQHPKLSYLGEFFIDNRQSPVSLEHQGDQTFLFLSPCPLWRV